MIGDIFHSLSDKSESALRGILRAQARLRAAFVPAVVATQAWFFGIPEGLTPGELIYLLGAYAVYFVLPFVLTNLVGCAGILVATAIVDPLMLTIWIAVSGKFGSIVAGFYVFTTLGFGFRTGRPLMYLCQVASLVGFSLILALSPYWQQQLVLWIALCIPLVVVPLYAGSLIGSLQQARKLAEDESRAKSDLLAKVSHELRTPLTGIVATADLLALESKDVTVQRRAGTIQTLSDSLLGEINNLLEEAKYDAQAMVINPGAFDLGLKIAVLQPTFEAMAAKKGVVFQSQFDSRIEDLVAGDAHYLNRVLLNLCGNAVKFTERGVVHLAAELLEQDADVYRIRFSVSDTGIGIPPAFHSRMFQPFAQVEQGTRRRFGGTGLGLALSRRAVAAMGGDLRFESELGKGSRFWFELALPRLRRLTTADAATSTPSVSPKRILVVEDNETNLMLIKEMLCLDRHQVTTCESGIAALEVLAQGEFDLLLLDYNLGDMDGIRVLQTYQYGHLHAAPAIFLTADATAQTADRIRNAGAACIIYKPVTLANLRSALTQVDFAAAPSTPVAPEQDVQARPERPALKVVQVSPIDMGIIDELRTISSRPGFLEKLLVQAMQDIARANDQLRDALVQRNHASIASVAHALKGVSANVGAVRLTAAMSTLMNLSSDEIDAARQKLAADVRVAVTDAMDALQAIVDDMHVASNGAGTRSLHLD